MTLRAERVAGHMEAAKGNAVFDGIAIGTIRVCRKEKCIVKRKKNRETAAEKQRFEAAKEEADRRLLALYQKALNEAGRANAQVIEVHRLILEDEEYNASIYGMIEQEKVCAEYAVAETGEKYARMFAGLEDEYFKARSADVRDVSECLLSILTGEGRKEENKETPMIICAEDLTPSQTLLLGKEQVLAFVTEKGSKNSHVAILAGAMEIPVVTGVHIQDDWEGKSAIVDGFRGMLYLEPDEKMLAAMQERQENYKKQRALLFDLKGRETVTGSGKKIKLYANIGSEKEAENALANDAEGIGLFRTEYLYLENSDFPGEEEQFQAYRHVVEAMAGKRIIIRTLDIGADKQADYFHLEPEENPALGYRAIRICLQQPEMFKTQLRAILRAAAFGNVAVMFPMIISVEEVKRAKELLAEAAKELQMAGKPCGRVETGVMIETPAAVMISDLLAEEVDFFSIGTNDLTQYTLAIDRQDPYLNPIYDDCHPAVLRMIQMTVENAHAAGIWAGICGELAADLTRTDTFLKMGVDEFSVLPAMVLPVRQKVLSYEEKEQE